MSKRTKELRNYWKELRGLLSSYVWEHTKLGNKIEEVKESGDQKGYERMYWRMRELEKLIRIGKSAARREMIKILEIELKESQQSMDLKVKKE